MGRGTWIVSQQPVVNGVIGSPFCLLGSRDTGIAQTTLEESDEEEEE